LAGSRPKARSACSSAGALPLGGPELVVAEAQGDAAPGEALAPHLAAAGPEEGLVSRGGIGIAPLVGEQLGVLLPVAGMVALQGLLAAAQVHQPAQAVGRFAAEGPLGLQLRTRLQHQHPQPGLGQHHGRHAAGGAGAHHDRVEGWLHGSGANAER